MINSYSDKVSLHLLFHVVVHKKESHTIITQYMLILCGSVRVKNGFPTSNTQ